MGKKSKYKLGGGRSAWSMFVVKDGDEVKLSIILGAQGVRRRQRAEYQGKVSVLTGGGTIQIDVADCLGEHSKKLLKQYAKEREIEQMTIQELVEVVNNGK